MRWPFQKNEASQLIHVKHMVPDIVHRIEKAVDPKPNMMYGEVANEEGQIWRLNPQQINGQAVMPVDFPLGFLTGRTEDHSKQVRIQFRLEYDQSKGW